jgi:hypothetical protein
MLQRFLRMSRGSGVEVGIAIPGRVHGPLAIAAVVLVGAGVVLGNNLSRAATGPDHAIVRVIDSGAPGG